MDCALAYNLLLGAGVSLDSQSGSINPRYNGGLPSVGKLTKDIADILPTMRAGSSLSRLYRNLTVDQVHEHITARFADCKPGATVKMIPNFRWKRIFTLNIDDALEEAYRTAEAPMQEPIPVSFKDVFFDNQNKLHVQIIHLHGYAKKPEDGYVFDIKEYMQSITDNSVWAHILGNIIRSEPFFVIGTSLEEPDITYFLADRDASSYRPDRPPSILVEPFPDQGTDKDCLDYSLSLYAGTANDFLKLADEKVPNRPSVLEVIHENLGDVIATEVPSVELAIFHSDFERVPATQQIHSLGGANFALGHSASWADLQADCDVPRGTETNALRALIRGARPLDVRLLLGAPGAGKSTILKRIALETTRAGTICFWRRSPGRVQLQSTANILKAINKPTYMFVDNFADHATEILELRKLLNGTQTVFVGAERSYRFEHANKVLGAEIVETYTVSSTGNDVAKRLIESYINLGLSETKREEAARLAPRIAGEQIAVACCRIINKYAPIETVIDKSIADANQTARHCYLIVALAAHCLRDGIQYDVLSRMMKGYQVELQMDDNSPLPITFRDLNDFELVAPLNETMSSGILKRFSTASPDDILRAFKSIATAIRPYVNLTAIRAGHPSSRLASRLFDYDEIVKELLGLDRANDFYSYAQKEWAWNSRYWHQISLMKLDAASVASLPAEKETLCQIAAQHARHAKTIEARHQFTLTTIGKVLFGKMAVLGRVSTSDLEEAIEALSLAADVERQRNRVSVHPFLILFEGIVSASTLGAVYSHAQRQKIRGLIQLSIEAFPRRHDIRTQAGRVGALL